MVHYILLDIQVNLTLLPQPPRQIVTQRQLATETLLQLGPPFLSHRLPHRTGSFPRPSPD